MYKFNDSEKQYEEQKHWITFQLNQYFESDEDLDNMEDMDLEDIDADLKIWKMNLLLMKLISPHQNIKK